MKDRFEGEAKLLDEVFRAVHYETQMREAGLPTWFNTSRKIIALSITSEKTVGHFKTIADFGEYLFDTYGLPHLNVDEAFYNSSFFLPCELFIMVRPKEKQ